MVDENDKASEGNLPVKIFLSAPKQAALVRASEIKRAWRKVMFYKVVML
jgi:hypothetical protein